MVLQHFHWVRRQRLKESAVYVVYFDFAKFFEKVDDISEAVKLLVLQGNWVNGGIIFLKGMNQTILSNAVRSQK